MSAKSGATRNYAPLWRIPVVSGVNPQIAVFISSNEVYSSRWAKERLWNTTYPNCWLISGALF